MRLTLLNKHNSMGKLKKRKSNRKRNSTGNLKKRKTNKSNK